MNEEKMRTDARRHWPRTLLCLSAASLLAACMTDQAAPVYQRSHVPGARGGDGQGAGLPGSAAGGQATGRQAAGQAPMLPTVPPGSPVFGRADGDAAGAPSSAYRKTTPNGVKRPYVEGSPADGAPQVGVIAATTLPGGAASSPAGVAPGGRAEAASTANAVALPSVTPAPAASSSPSPSSLSPSTSPSTAAAAAAATGAATAPATGATTGATSDAVPARGNGAVDGVPFGWPVRSALSQDWSQTGKRGVVFDGQPGDPVLAAADGDVIFSGAGPRGYGKLIIISHAKELLSVYGHNRTLLVKEGQKVKRGQRIAELGDSGTDRPGLHFEIRKQGNAVDPLSVLSRR